MMMTLFLMTMMMVTMLRFMIGSVDHPKVRSVAKAIKTSTRTGCAQIL